MKHLCLAFLGCSLVTVPTPVDHASLAADGTNAKSCESRTMVMNYLSAEYAEKPVAMGVAENGGLIEVLSSRDGSTFTIRSEEHTSELQSLMRISYAVFCLKKQIT